MRQANSATTTHTPRQSFKKGRLAQGGDLDGREPLRRHVVHGGDALLEDAHVGVARALALVVVRARADLAVAGGVVAVV